MTNGDPLAVRRNPGADAARDPQRAALRAAAALQAARHLADHANRVVKVWLKGTPTQREEMRATWPELAEVVDALAWRPLLPAGTPQGHDPDAGTPQAPASPQRRPERVACAIEGLPTDDGHTHTRADWFAHRTAEMKANLEARAPGDMHEPRPYPASGLHFE